MAGQGRSILVIDDESSDLDLIRLALENSGFTVWDAECYDRGLDAFHAHRGQISMVIVDVSLPRKNGVELAKELLLLEPALKVLFVSGHVGAEVIRFYGLSASDRHFLRKPFQADSLTARVEEILASTDTLKSLDSGGKMSEASGG